MPQPWTPSLGSVSHGTMRNEDLIPAFRDELADCAKRRFRGKLTALEHDWRLRVREMLAMARKIKDFDSEDATEALHGLIDALNEFSPAYSSFRTHEGDGSDYGWWPDVDSLEEEVRDGNVIKVDDTGEVTRGYTGYVMHVNDHGNVTLYFAPHDKLDLEEVWACV